MGRPATAKRAVSRDSADRQSLGDMIEVVPYKELTHPKPIRLGSFSKLDVYRARYVKWNCDVVYKKLNLKDISVMSAEDESA